MTRKKKQPAARPARSVRPPAADVFASPAGGLLAEKVALLALAAQAAPAPSAKVKAQLLARIRATKRPEPKPAPVPAGWRFDSTQSDEGWRETFPGVRFKTLSVDDARDVVMLFVEMQPGSRIPDHPHDTSADEGVVITGDVAMDGRLMRPGDYFYAGVGTVHTNVTSPSGCTALLSLRASAWRQWREKLAAR